MKIGLSTKQLCNVPSKVSLNVKLTLGAASIASTKGKGITATRSSAGLYVLTLDKPYSTLVGCSIGVFSPLGTIAGGRVTAKTTLATLGKISITICDWAGAAADGDAGDEVYIEIKTIYDGVGQVF